MEDADEALADGVEDLRIGADGGAGVALGADADGGHGGGVEDLAGALEGGDGDGDVLRVREPVGVDDGGVGGVGGPDGHVAAGVGRHGGRGDAGVVVTVLGLVPRRQVAEEGGRDDVLHVGPVGGEGDVVLERRPEAAVWESLERCVDISRCIGRQLKAVAGEVYPACRILHS